MSYTDNLVKSYITEAYQPKPAASPADQEAAEKAFKAELTNGPVKNVWYGSRQYPKKVGSFDLENYHKAFDQYFIDNDLIDDLFNDKGLLINRATYGVLKNLDSKIPAVKATLQLWGAQFKNELEFLDAKLEREAEEAKKAAEEKTREERIKELTDSVNNFRDAVAVEVNTIISGLQEWKDLEKAYENQDIHPEISVDIRPRGQYVISAEDRISVDAAVFIINCAAKKNSDRMLGHIANPSSEFIDDITHDLIDPKVAASKLLSDMAEVKEMLKSLRRDAIATGFFHENYLTYMKIPAGQVCGSGGRVILYDRMTEKFYIGEFKNIDTDVAVLSKNTTQRECLVVYDPKNPTNKAIKVMPYFKVAAAFIRSFHTEGRCYTHTIAIWGWINTVPKSLLDELDIAYTEVDGGNGREDVRVLNHIGIANEWPNYKDIFDYISIRDFELDSSD